MRVRGLALASVSAAALAAGMLSARPAAAQSFVVNAGNSPAGQQVVGAGGTGLVEPDGVIATTANSFAGDGVTASGGGATVINRGSITTAGIYAAGVVSFGPNAVISNSGLITTAGDAAYGVVSNGPNVVITNSGTITTAGVGAYGVGSGDANAVITNSGTITTAGSNAHGVYSQGANAAIGNSGRIATSGAGAMGINADGGGPNATIANSGTIAVSGSNAYGILSNSGNATITNSGAIFAIGPGGYAIAIGNAGNALTLLRGSLLQGDLWVGVPVAPTTTLNIATGQSTALRFDLAGPPGFPGALPGTITAPGMLLVVNTATGIVATADPATVRNQGQSQSLGDLTSGIFAAVDGRGGSGAVATPLSSYAPEDRVRSAFAAFHGDEARYSRTAWVKGFGGLRTADGSGFLGEQRQTLAGAVSGLDLYASANGIAGVFLGGSWGRNDVEGSQQVTAESFFGGVYATLPFGTATLDLSIALGRSHYDSSRLVLDNTVAGGIASAKSGYDGFFVAPRLAWTQPFRIGAQKFEAKLSGHYAGLFLDGFSETGTIAPLSLDGRDVHLFVGRAGLSMPLEQSYANGVTRVIPTIGIEGRTQTGNTLASGTLAGIGVLFDAGQGGMVGGFANLRIEHDMTSRLAFFLETEGLVEDTGARRLFATGGVKMKF